MIDNLGNEYNVREVYIGQRKSSFLSGIPNVYVAGIPTKVSLLCKGFSLQASQVALIEINCWDFKAQLRNVPLSK